MFYSVPLGGCASQHISRKHNKKPYITEGSFIQLAFKRYVTRQGAFALIFQWPGLTVPVWRNLAGRKTLEDLSNIRGDSAASSGSIHRLTSLREMYHTASLLDEGDPLLATPTPKRLSGIPAALQSTTTPIASPVLSRKSSAKRKILPPSPKVSEWTGVRFRVFCNFRAQNFSF